MSIRSEVMRYRSTLQTPATITVPNPKLKGVRGGNCNRTACQKPGANYWHTGVHAWYCVECMREINRLNRNDAMRMYGVPKLIVCPDTMTPEELALWTAKGITIPEESE